MKPSSLLLLCSFFLLAISTQAQNTKVKSKSSKTTMKAGAVSKTSTDSTRLSSPAMDAPLTATYSSQFEIGDAKNSQMVLELWKDWSNNKLSDHSSYFSDSLVILTSDGTVLRGLENVGPAMQKTRDTYSDITTTVIAITPLKSIDKNENWVAIWGMQKATGKNGAVTSERLNEVWRINKDGKIDYMEQLSGKEPENQ